MWWTKGELGTAKFFIILNPLTKHQDQNFTSPDIKESTFLKFSLGTYWCHKLQYLSSINFFCKTSYGQERKKKRKSEVQKFENVKDKRSFFVKIRSISDNFSKFYFDGKNKKSGHKL